MIELRGVCKRVPSGTGTLTILHPLDLSIPSGRVVAITGPSGSGKSTLLGLLAGLDSPSEGSVTLDGVDITALENVLVPMEIAGAKQPAKRASTLLADVGLADRTHHYPSQLSGGEQQRVAIARALANDPPLLLADEPTGNLDSQTGRQIIELLLEVNRVRKTTIVLVTHDPELAALADLTIALRDGRVARLVERTGGEPAVAAS